MESSISPKLDFDMDEYVKNNFDNSNFSLEVLRKHNYWVHFTNVSAFYDCLFPNGDPTVSSSHSKMAHLHYALGSSANLRTGVSQSISGHLIDSCIYVRRTVESVRYSAFIREEPEGGKLWFQNSGGDEFKRKYKSWFSRVGKSLVELEFPKSNRYYMHSSTFGPHANIELFSHLHTVTLKDQNLVVRGNYHQIEPNLEGCLKLLGNFFWHIEVHAGTIDWWIFKSGFTPKLDSDLLRYWSDCKSRMMVDRLFVKDSIAKFESAKRSSSVNGDPASPAPPT